MGSGLSLTRFSRVSQMRLPCPMPFLVPAWHGTCLDRSTRYLHRHNAGTLPVTFTPLQRAHSTARQEDMDRPRLDPLQHAHEALYAFIGRVSLLLVEHNVDAITSTMFLRENVEAGGSALSMEQAKHITSSYVDIVTRVVPQ